MPHCTRSHFFSNLVYNKCIPYSSFRSSLLCILPMNEERILQKENRRQRSREMREKAKQTKFTVRESHFYSCHKTSNSNKCNNITKGDGNSYLQFEHTTHLSTYTVHILARTHSHSFQQEAHGLVSPSHHSDMVLVHMFDIDFPSSCVCVCSHTFKTRVFTRREKYANVKVYDSIEVSYVVFWLASFVPASHPHIRTLSFGLCRVCAVCGELCCMLHPSHSEKRKPARRCCWSWKYIRR